MSNVIKFPIKKLISTDEPVPVDNVLKAVADHAADEIMIFTRKMNMDGGEQCDVFTSVGGPQELLLLIEIAKAFIIDQYR